MEKLITRCLTCGEDLEPNSKGIPTCKCCGRQYKDAVGEFSSDLKEIANRRQLREFIQAEELGRELLKKQPESSEIYWQILLASLGVVYVQEDGKSKPTFFSYSYDDRTLIADNENYKNAIKYAKGVENRIYYESQAQELDKLLKEFFGLVAKEASYDIFISFKRTTTATVDGEERQIDTDDYYKAKEIYEYLNKKYKVFFSPVSIGQDTGIEGEKYEPRILKALQTSQAMILLGSRTEYLEAQWVQNEWRRYQYFIHKGKKNKSSLILGYEKFMPVLPPALKDIQLPSFDWFKASYLKDLESKLVFVKTSKGIKSTIKERKISSDFGTDASFGSYTGKRVAISGAENIGIVLSPNEARELDEAGKVLQNGDFAAAKKLYDRIIHNNGNNSKAFWGRFKANIKARTDSEVPQSAAKNIVDIYLKDIYSAIDCSTDEKFSWNIVDLLVEALKSDRAWAKTKIIFGGVIKYLDDRRTATALDYLIHNAINKLKSNVKTAEDIVGSARQLFFDENKEKAIACLEAYAQALLDSRHFNLARKYYEELASIKRSGKAYFNLLACRVGVTDLSKAKFALNVNPNDDASIKKPSKLDLDEIIERILICNNEAGDTAADAQVEEIALYQIQHNKNNCKPFIETIISCYAALDKKTQIVDFLMKVAERFIQIKDFKNAKLYYNEVLSHDPNYSKAHWGLLMVRFKAIDENDLIKHRKVLIDAPEYQNAKNCADNDEFAHYTDILNGVKQYYKNPYSDDSAKVPNPNERVYKYLTRKRRLIIENIPALILIIFGIVLLVKPSPILRNINFGWIIAPYVFIFCSSLIIAITRLAKSERDKVYKYVKRHCAIMIAGAVIFISLMSVGVGLGQERVKNEIHNELLNEFYTKYENVINGIENDTYFCEFSDAKTLNTFIVDANERGIFGTIQFTMTNNFGASVGLQIVDDIVVGIGNCTDKYIFFDKPIKDYAFDGASQPRRVFFLEGCGSIGQRAFRSCGNLTRAYFMQSQVPKIGGGLFSYTWNDSSFKIVVPENLLSAYKRVNADYWYELYNSQYTTIQFPISIKF